MCTRVRLLNSSLEYGTTQQLSKVLSTRGSKRGYINSYSWLAVHCLASALICYLSIKMTFRTLLDKPITTCVVCWPEEDNKLSVVPAKKIVSPRPNDFAPDTFCKVQGLESHPCKIVAMGTVAEMIKKIRQLEAGEDSEPSTATEDPLPRRKPGMG